MGESAFWSFLDIPEFTINAAKNINIKSDGISISKQKFMPWAAPLQATSGVCIIFIVKTAVIIRINADFNFLNIGLKSLPKNIYVKVIFIYDFAYL